MLRTLISRSLVALVLAALLGVSTATPAQAYGRANWQIGFAGTATLPSTGVGFGFWGWCAFAGGVTSGNDGDCEFSQYFHGPAGSGFTCQLSIDVTDWTAARGTFIVNAATITARPAAVAAPCLAFFPGPAGFPVDTQFPAAAGHYNLGPLVLGVPGELQVTVAQIH
jgi:hypothetical protein